MTQPNSLTSISEILNLIEDELSLNTFKTVQLKECKVMDILSEAEISLSEINLLSNILIKLLEFPSLEVLDLFKTSLKHIIQQPKNIFVKDVISVAITKTGQTKIALFWIEVLQSSLLLAPNHLVLLDLLFGFYTIAEKHQEALQNAYHFYDLAPNLFLKVQANYKILFILMRMAAWTEINEIAERHKQLITQLIQTEPTSLDLLAKTCWQDICLPFLYYQDNLAENRWFQNQTAKLLQLDLNPNLSEKRVVSSTKKILTIGYIAGTLKRHSVGWLCRWLFQYHNREQFNIGLYLVNQPIDDVTQKWFLPNVSYVRNCPSNPHVIASQIQADQVDILIDLDSITNATTCQVMCLKPAPIQVTWLGMDASGIPAIDYFIADPYVLPENAEHYYQEKIWRLPQTYLAVAGFEVGVPTLKREDLNIPKNAIIYLTVQSGYKRHPDTIRLQLEILKAVPNSYLLIKGFADQNIIQDLFNNLCIEIGIDSSRLRFLPQYDNEETHRANLQIADIVLDTYPYNGATTTLEVLWMGIPLVTKVGEQFAARNSYTFLKNAGIEEGISWTDKEYIQWGMRLGLEESLRKEVIKKLQLSRQTAPVWNARQFTQEIEQAYQKMWSLYQDKSIFLGWNSKIYPFILEGNYHQVIQYYEQIIEDESENISDYWYLGLAYLLQGDEAESQATWFLILSQASSEEIELWTRDLVTILETEAIRQEELENLETCWLIRKNIQEIEPENINNLLDLTKLQIQLNQFSPEWLEEIEMISLLNQAVTHNINSELLLHILSEVLNFPSYEALSFAQASIQYLDSDSFIRIVSEIASRRAYDYGQGNYASELITLCLSIKPDNIELLDQSFWFNMIDENYPQALDVAHQFYKIVTRPDLKVLATYKILYVLLNSGDWLKVNEIAQHHKILLKEFLDANLTQLHPLVRESLLGFTMPLLYLQDNPLETRQLQNQISTFFQSQLLQWLNHTPYSFKNKTHPHPLKIGYIANTLRRHSVGWLSRWLMKYHDKNNFQIYLYLVNQPEDDITEKWFYPNAHKVHQFQRNPQAIAHQIRADEIDILVDLDSLTHNITSQVMCLKPAPIQVTWLGMDASGIPTIDYFIADPYVLPENAPNYYPEKIWRLPQTYLAIDGFEVGVPTLKREDLNIPDDAIVYLSVQSGLKRHPEMIRLQLEIIKSVPDSYLLIKGFSDTTIIQQLFNLLAQEIGISPSKLRFLPQYENEETHRANLQIADVVLDTYPYNGATTTLEVLWMGIPLVTKVGEQFAARNSYTFLKNVGVEEGIAISDEEYLQWGIRLGKEEELRRQVACKLKKSRSTAPLWNAQQFTRDMEQAYQQMWINFILAFESQPCL